MIIAHAAGSAWPASDPMSDELARMLRQEVWEIWRDDTLLGTVSWTGEKLLVDGPETQAIDRLLASMQGGEPAENLFRSLPFRLTGGLSVAYPPD